MSLSTPPELTAELDAILSARSLWPVFQPIVDLHTAEPVAYEALARGPVGSPLQMPDHLFATARSSGRLRELDRLCQSRALETAIEADLPAPLGLFLNVEPAAIGSRWPPATLLAALRERGVRLVIELTERALTDDPARLLAFANWARSAGWGVALDDVGTDPHSLALMPFLRPDVVKLDLRLVQQRPDDAVAEIMTAVTAYAEQSGAYVLAEGIETPQHEHMARSLGATLGQGWRYGRPGSLPTAGKRRTTPQHPLVLQSAAERPVNRSPFAAAARLRTPQRGSKSLLVAVSKLLERQAAELHGLAVVLAAFEEARHFTPASSRRYAGLAASTAFVVALGAGLPPEPVPGVRGANLEGDDPVLGEWDIAVIGPHFAAALVARDLNDDGPDEQRTFDYVLTYDREIVLEVAASLMTRTLPISEESRIVPAQFAPADYPYAASLTDH